MYNCLLTNLRRRFHIEIRGRSRVLMTGGQFHFASGIVAKLSVQFDCCGTARICRRPCWVTNVKTVIHKQLGDGIHCTIYSVPEPSSINTQGICYYRLCALVLVFQTCMSVQLATDTARSIVDETERARTFNFSLFIFSPSN